jgi:hypothetical protein
VKVPKRRIPNEYSQAKDPKRKVPSKRSQAKDPKPKVITNVTLAIGNVMKKIIVRVALV